jgi:hypothetical protein
VCSLLFWFSGTKKRKAKLQNTEVDFTENEKMVTEHEAKTESKGTTDEPVVQETKEGSCLF